MGSSWREYEVEGHSVSLEVFDVLFDTDKHQRGLRCESQWVEFLPYAPDDRVFNDSDLTVEEITTVTPPGTMLVTCGTIREVHFGPKGEQSWIDGKIEGAAFYRMEDAYCLATGSDILHGMDKEQMQRLNDAGMRNALAAIEEVAYFNDPSNFVLEETPPSFERRMRKKPSKKSQSRILRYCDRPRYTVLKPRQIRKRMHLPEPGVPGGMKRRPHERRAHLRTYSDDAKRWPNKHGQTFVVKGSWIGPSESVVNGKRYRVLVDMRPPQLPEVVTKS